MKLEDESVSNLPLLSLPIVMLLLVLVLVLVVGDLLGADGEVGENDAAEGDAEAEAEAESEAEADGVEGRGRSNFRTDTRLERCADPNPAEGVVAVINGLVILSRVSRCMSELD